MNVTLKTAAVLLCCSALLSGCGGGGDDNAGSLTQLSVVPSEVEWTGGPGACAVGATSRVYVHGGAAPYRLQNTSPDGISLDRTQVDNRNDYFEVTLLGMCMEDVEVVVLDANDRRAILTVTNTEGEED
jgi:hypothetical protein